MSITECHEHIVGRMSKKTHFETLSIEANDENRNDLQLNI